MEFEFISWFTRAFWLLYTSNVKLIFEGKYCKQMNEAAKGYRLGLVSAGDLIAHMERTQKWNIWVNALI